MRTSYQAGSLEQIHTGAVNIVVGMVVGMQKINGPRVVILYPGLKIVHIHMQSILAASLCTEMIENYKREDAFRGLKVVSVNNHETNYSNSPFALVLDDIAG